MKDLFEPYDLAGLRLGNRIVMAPMARGRAAPGNRASPMMAQYYAQRATAGLMISEAIAVSPEGRNHVRCCGLYEPEQVSAWRAVTDHVHREGGLIFAQLLHSGRAGHEKTLGHRPWAPSAIAATTSTLTRDGFEPCSMPQEMDGAMITSVVASFAQAALNAMAAGFDGIEIHAANGYLLDQFLKDGSNHRTDQYGGTIENRQRLLMQVIDAVCSAADRLPVGVRIAPGPAQDAADSAPGPLFGHVVRELVDRPIAYVHCIEGVASGRTSEANVDYAVLRAEFPRCWIANNGFTLESAQAAIAEGRADLVSWGRAFVANPDLVARFKENHPLAQADKALFFVGEERGLVDYPRMDGNVD